MPLQPTPTRAVAFFDGQNLFHAAREAFGFTYPSYDPLALTAAVCGERGWEPAGVRFYTGLPDASVSPVWHQFWVRKLAAMGSRHVWTYSRSLRYRNEQVTLPGGTHTTVLVGREKGVDVRIALDVIRLAADGALDVALVFSQDQDLSEVAEEVKALSIRDQRWLKVACAFPSSPTSHNPRGINGTEWIRLDRDTYDQCQDPNDYRAPVGSG